MHVRWILFSLLALLCLPACEDTGGAENDPTARMAHWTRGLVEKLALLDDRNAVGGPLATMCAPGYAHPNGGTVACDAQVSGVYPRATYTFPNTTNGIEEFNGSSCRGYSQTAQCDQSSFTITVDPVTKIATILWRISCDIYKMPNWASRLWIGGTLTWEQESDGTLTFVCNDSTSVAPGMVEIPCADFEVPGNYACEE